jgi:hypothetical protein
MSPRIMSSKTLSALSVCFVIGALAVFAGASANAAPNNESTGAAVAPPHVRHAYAPRHWWRFSGPTPRTYGYVNVPPGAIVGPGYVFVPGRGILDEACNLPTSTCPNTMRDTQ